MYHLNLTLGKIPLRQLVYRVLDLPPSLRPLVYDFGQLNQDTEDNYIAHIVGDHVCLAVAHSNKPSLYRSVLNLSFDSIST